MGKEMFILETRHISHLIYAAVKKKNSKFICILFIHQEVKARFNFKLKFYFKSVYRNLIMVSVYKQVHYVNNVVLQLTWISYQLPVLSTK